MWLFKGTDDFEKFETDSGWREYYVFNSQNGWMHRTQILDEHGKPLARVNALEREYVAPKLDDDYGTESYQNRLLANTRMELKDALKKKKLKRILKK